MLLWHNVHTYCTIFQRKLTQGLNSFEMNYVPHLKKCTTLLRKSKSLFFLDEISTYTQYYTEETSFNNSISALEGYLIHFNQQLLNVLETFVMAKMWLLTAAMQVTVCHGGSIFLKWTSPLYKTGNHYDIICAVDWRTVLLCLTF